MWGLKKWISAIRLSKEITEETTQTDKKTMSDELSNRKERSEGDSKRTKDPEADDEYEHSTRRSKDSRKRKRRKSARCVRRSSSPFNSYFDGSPLPSVISDRSYESLTSPSSKHLSQITGPSSHHHLSKSMSSSAMPPNALITTWWECTPNNMHTVVLNFLYDADNSRCDLIWTIIENIVKYPREKVFYTLLTALAIFIAFSEPARFIYYATGFAYPMFKTFRLFKYGRSDEYSRQLRYWVVFGWFALVDVFLYSYMEERPIYWTLKTVFVTYLLLPFVRGSDLIYHDFVRSFNKRIQVVIDSFSYYHE